MRVLANVHIEPGNRADEANARLITSAPDLLEALQSALPHLRDNARFLRDIQASTAQIVSAFDAVAQVEAAISRALGQGGE